MGEGGSSEEATNNLYQALRARRIDDVRAALDAGASVTRFKQDRTSPLAMAVMCLSGEEAIEIAGRMLDSGANIHDFYAASQVARNGKRDVLQFLISRGFDPQMKNPITHLSKETILEEAVSFGQIDMIKMLWDYGLDSDGKIAERIAKKSLKDSFGPTHEKLCHDIIDLARARRGEKPAETDSPDNLLKRAADTNDLDALNAAIKAGAKLTTKLAQAALANAVMNNSEKIVERLLEAGADAKRGALLTMSWGSAPITRMLIEAGADPNAHPKKDITALMAAAELGGLEQVTMLINAGAEVNARCGRYTVLDRYLVDGDSPKIEAALRAAGAKTGKELGPTKKRR